MPPAHQRQLGQFIREHREEKGLSLRALADKSGVSYATISRWEQGMWQQPKVEMLERLAPHLGVRLADLFAIAGLAQPRERESLPMYLRSEFGLPEELAPDVEQYLRALMNEYKVKLPKRGGRRGHSAR